MLHIRKCNMTSVLAVVYVLLGRAVTEYRWGGSGTFTFMCHEFLVLTLTVKKLLKSVHIYISYGKIKTGVSLFGPPCRSREGRMSVIVSEPGHLSGGRAIVRLPGLIRSCDSCTFPHMYNVNIAVSFSFFHRPLFQAVSKYEIFCVFQWH